MDKLQRLMRMTDPQARHEQVSSADMGESGEVDDTVSPQFLPYCSINQAPKYIYCTNPLISLGV